MSPHWAVLSEESRDPKVRCPGGAPGSPSGAHHITPRGVLVNSSCITNHPTASGRQHEQSFVIITPRGSEG